MATASVWNRLMTAARAGYAAFRETSLSSDDDHLGTFGSYDARLFRYALYWSAYENTMYRDIHSWATKMRADLGLYQYTRSIFSPAFRLAEFHVAHIHGGALDPDAGDGVAIPSALPIITDQQALRSAISQLWQNSNWAIQKDQHVRYGCIGGDIGLEAVDDELRKKVYLRVVRPSLLQDVDRDPFGNVKGYVRVETRPHPETGKDVTYTEMVTRDGDTVVYRTFLNDAPYDWEGKGTAWDAPYGFVPLVLNQHINVGRDWGWSELHAGLPKIREADDLASKLHDQIRKLVDSPWLFGGVSPPQTTPRTTGAAATAQRPEPGRQEIPALYGPVGATATPLVAPLDIAGAGARIDALLKELERDYPELQMDIWSAAGNTSGRALRVARQRAETKIQQRRAGYDDTLVRAQQMAVAIGGYRGYDGFTGFGLDSYAAGTLDHRIGERPVFASDPLDDLEEKQVFWSVIETATRAGIPVVTALREAGWDEAKIAAYEQDAALQQTTAAAAFGATFDRGGA